VDQGGRRLLSFPAAADRQKVTRAAAELRKIAAGRRGRYLRIESIDGRAAHQSPLAEAMRQAEFSEDYKGLVLEAR